MFDLAAAPAAFSPASPAPSAWPGFGAAAEAPPPWAATASDPAAAAEAFGHYGDAQLLTARRLPWQDVYRAAHQAQEQRRAVEVQDEAERDPLYGKDPQLARERADARRDLHGLFEVVDPKKVGDQDRRQNQLTAEELERVTKLYAEIKAGRSDLRIETPEHTDVADREGEGEPHDVLAARQRQAALRQVARIMQTRSGRDLVGELADNRDARGGHRVTTIRATSNAEATDTSTQAGVVTVPVDKAGYTAGAMDTSWASLFRPDVTLYHELVHAHQRTHGGVRDLSAADRAQLPSGDRTLDKHELQAAGLGPYRASRFNENRYREERNHITESGRWNDFDLHQSTRERYADWRQSWQDGVLSQRPMYSPPVDKRD